MATAPSLAELPRVPILELDPDLAAAVDPDQIALATRYATAPLITVPAGPWIPPEPSGPGTIGYLVLGGLLARAITFAGRTTSELLGEGDLLRPWDQDAGGENLEMRWSWTVIEPARIAVLDRRFAAVVARWPSLVDALVCRALRRSRTLAFQLTVAQVKRVEDRLLLMLWQLADRWGRVGPEGVLVPVGLTHETLAMLVGARRPTVTTALGRLARAGRVERRGQGWLLHGEDRELSAA
jgi:CRP-like cAMP-binding protein